MPGAVAVELVHNFSLIHDDIIDTDTERHHRPTVWSVYGIGPAIVAGDALQILAHQILLETPFGSGAAASAALADATAAMIAGQADDIAFEGRRDVSVEQCMAMSAAKTGALLGCAASMGAILAGAPVRRSAPCATTAAISDWPSRRSTTSSGSGAIRPRPASPPAATCGSGRRSMPVVSALAAGGPESDELRDLISGPIPTAPLAAGDAGADKRAEPELSGDIGATSKAATAPTEPTMPLDPDQVERATYLVEVCGGREWTAVRAKANLDAALGALERVRLSAIPHRDLADLAVYVVERDS